MTGTRATALFALGFLAVALLLAGVVSYAADSDPDGLDAVTRTGCQTVRVGGEEQVVGRCIAQSQGDHATAGGPLAGYTVGGDDALTGVAGVIGVVATLLVAVALFSLLGRRHGAAGAGDAAAPGDPGSGGPDGSGTDRGR